MQNVAVSIAIYLKPFMSSIFEVMYVYYLRITIYNYIDDGAYLQLHVLYYLRSKGTND